MACERPGVDLWISAQQLQHAIAEEERSRCALRRQHRAKRHMQDLACIELLK